MNIDAAMRKAKKLVREKIKQKNQRVNDFIVTFEEEQIPGGLTIILQKEGIKDSL